MTAALAALALGSTMATAAAAQDTASWPTTGWARSTPAAQRMNAGPLDSLHRRISSGEFGHVDRLVVTRGGYLVASHRYPHDYREISRGRRAIIGCGTDACTAWDKPADFNYFDPDRHPFYRGRDVHSLQSVTKSVASTLIGIAIQRGSIPGVSSPLLPFFADYDVSRADPRLRRATLADLLTMRSGIEWHEGDRPFDSSNTTIQLEFSPDWVRFTLSQPMDSDPGTKWAYNSGGSHLMSAIIRKSTGTTIDKYAEQQLFGPLGIRDYHWKLDPQGLPDCEGGLYLEAEQLAKIGYLFLRDGVWQGQRILPDGWVRDATARHVDRVNNSGTGYGYQWWRLDRRGVDVWAGQGFGGQYLLVIPSLDVVAVANAWNIFGERAPALLGPLINALIDSAGQGQSVQ
jgi:hypothetical protein